MTVTAEDISALAERLVDGSFEVEWRTSASRSFYAGYHRTLPLGAKFDAGVSGGKHEALIKHLLDGAGESLAARKTLAMRIGYKLQALRGLRVTADYELDVPFSRADAANALKLSADLSGLVGGFG